MLGGFFVLVQSSILRKECTIPCAKPAHSVLRNPVVDTISNDFGDFNKNFGPTPFW